MSYFQGGDAENNQLLPKLNFQRFSGTRFLRPLTENCLESEIHDL